MREEALADLKVVEFGAFAAGPHVGKHLCDHGAEVIHVESRTRPDGFRGNYPPYKDGLAGPERAGMFAMTHNDKLGVTLNLKTPGGLELARRLVDRADVVIENFTPSTISRLGLAYEECSGRNAGLVMLSTCNQGQTGPNAQRAGFGTHLTAMSGFIHLTGWPDRDPSLLWGPYIDYIAVAYGTVAILTALDRRLETGLGCHVDLSQYETGLQFMAPALLSYFASGEVAERAGNTDPSGRPHGVYRCAGDERWVALSAHDEAERERLRVLVGWPPEAGGEQVEAHLVEWVAGHTREGAVAELRVAGVHAAPVNDMRDLFEDPQLQAMGVWRRVHHPVIGEHAVEAPPFVLSETPARIQDPAPLLGQHNREVFCGLLQLSRDEFAEREAAGVFE